MIDEFAHDLEAMWRRLRGHGHESGQPAMQQRNGPVIHEILDPEFLLAQLNRVKHTRLGAQAGGLTDEQFDAMYAKLREERDSPKVGASAQQGAQAMLPNEASVSILQSTLTDCVTSRLEDLVKPLPPGQRSFAEFVMREADIFRKFGPCDVSWVETTVAQGISLFEGRPSFPGGKAPDVQLAENARIVVVGDWGTGLPGARAVGSQMAKFVAEAKREGREVHALHLGDVYYSGWKEEYRARFLPYWPVGPGGEGVRSWAINGNHDMYSGGHGFFGYLLADPRFAAQNGSSYFCLENKHWQILGLDTAYADKDLAGDQQQWLKSKLEASSRKTMLLTHHQAYSAFETVDHAFISKVLEALGERTIDAWLWGHEHMCCAYKPRPAELPLDFSTCIGHGGVPVLLNEDATPDTVSWRFTESEVHEGQDKWQLFGFAVLDFEGPQITLRYFDQNGNKNGTAITIGGNGAQQAQE